MLWFGFDNTGKGKRRGIPLFVPLQQGENAYSQARYLLCMVKKDTK
jgi:hypothetical protein